MAATVLQMQEARKASADNAISELYNVIAYYLEQLPDEEEIVTWYTNYTKKIIETANDMYKQECYADAISYATRNKGEIYKNVIEKLRTYKEKQEKEHKKAESAKPSLWSGTGFALKNSYIITNHHVAEEAKNIEVSGINGDFTKSYKAKVVGMDKVCDLALLKIEDEDFKGFGTIPYSFKSAMVDVGEDVYVLGYPLIQTMGEEIKLTNGIISSRSGFDGNIANYQISVPLQPGNSGGPMFDMKGNLVGVVCAKHAEAENASYAIKASYLKNLVESVADLSILPTNNSMSGLQLKDQVKKARNFVYVIKCSK